MIKAKFYLRILFKKFIKHLSLFEEINCQQIKK